MLDGLLYHESELRIEEHYTDTSGFTDPVFTLCHTLGFQLAPRIHDLQERFPNQELLCTDMDASPLQILWWFALRWQMEATCHAARPPGRRDPTAVG